MKKFIKCLALGLSALLALGSFTACGDTSYGPAAPDDANYSEIVAATVGDEKIMLDEANFFLRREQWGYESYAWSIYTSYGYDNPWSVPYNDYMTMDVYMKEYVLSGLIQERVLISHASEYDLSYDSLDMEAIEEQAKTAFEELEGEFFIYAPVTQDQVTEWFKTNALATLVHEAIIEKTEVEVTDDEINMYTVKYIKFEDDEEETTAEDEADADVTEEETAEETVAEETTAATAEGETTAAETTAEETKAALQTGEEKADAFYKQLEAGKKFDELDEADEDIEATETSLLKVADDDTKDNILYTQTKGLKTGEYVKFYSEEDEKWIVAYCENDTDDEATADKKESVTDEKKEEEFSKLYEKWVGATSVSVTSDWNNLVLTDGTKIVPDETEEEETGAVVDADADALDVVESYAEGNEDVAGETDEVEETEASETAAE